MDNSSSSNEEGDYGQNMFKVVQKKYQEEMHDMLDDLSMPNQSMTISNLSQISQSPFRGGATQTREMGFGQSTQSASNLGHHASSQSLSTIGGEQEFGSSRNQVQVQQFGNLDTVDVIDNFHGKMGDLNIKDLSTDQADMVDYLKPKKQNSKQSGRNSPDFNGNTNSDLSKFDYGDQMTARSHQPKQSETTPQINKSEKQEFVRDLKQNRTFADSVVMQGKQQQLKKDSSQPLAFNRGFATLTPNDDEEYKEEEQLDLSALTKPLGSTVQEKKAPQSDEDGISAMTVSQYGGLMDKSIGNVSAISGMYTKRSPYINRFKNMENEESLSMTPNNQKDESTSDGLKSSTSDFKSHNLKHQQLQNRFLSVIEDTKPNSHEQQKLRVELTMLKTQHTQTQKELQTTLGELKAIQQLNFKENKQNIELQNKISEIQDQNKLLNQNIKDGAQLPSYLSRAQDNARKEISQLKNQLCDRDQQVAKLQRQINKDSEDQYNMDDSYKAEITTLCDEIDKQKLLVSSLKKQSEMDSNELKQQIKEMIDKHDDEQLSLKARIIEYDNYIQNIIKEYQEKEGELQQSFQVQKQFELQNNKIMKENSLVKQELDGFQERCISLEKELQIIKGDNKQKQFSDNQFEKQLESVKQINQKQVAQLKQDKTQMRDQIETLTNKNRALTSDPMVPKLEEQIIEQTEYISNYQIEMKKIAALLKCSNESIFTSLHDQLIEFEESKLIGEEYKAIQVSYTGLQLQLKAIEAEKEMIQLQLKDKHKQLNSAPSNFTKNLLIQKDKEISELKQNLDGLKVKNQSQEEDIWKLQKEVLDTNVTAKQTSDFEIEKMIESQNVRAEEYSQQIIEIQAKLEWKQSEIGQIQGELEGVQKQNQSLQNEIYKKNSIIPPSLTFEQIETNFEIEPIIKEIDIKQFNSQSTQAIMADPEHEVLQNQIIGLIEELQAVKDQNDLNNEDNQKQLQIVNSQKDNLEIFEIQIKKLQEELTSLTQEKTKEQYKAQQSFSTAQRVSSEELAKVRRELAQKSQKIEIMIIEQDQFEQEIERMRKSEKDMVQQLGEKGVVSFNDAQTQCELQQQEETRGTPVQDKTSKYELKLQKKDDLIESLQAEIDVLNEEISQLNSNESQILNEANQESQALQDQNEQLLENLQETKQSEQIVIQQKESLTETISKLESQLKECNSKFEKQVMNLQSEMQNGQESVVQKMFKQHEEEVAKIKLNHSQQLADIEHQNKLLEVKVQKSQTDFEREGRKLKDEVERVQRIAKDKLNKVEDENEKQTEMLEYQHKQKVEQSTQKYKKDLKQAQERMKVDILNATDAVKNELAKSKADWEREKRKIVIEKENDLNILRNKMEEESIDEMRQNKEKADKQFKKRLQDKENLWQTKFEDIEQEIEQLNQAHRSEIKMEKTKIEARLREQIRSEVNVEVHQNDLQNLTATQDAFCQTESERQNLMNETQMQIMHTEIQQIQDQYNKKLKEGPNLNITRNEMIQEFLKVLTFEFDKILLSLRMKSQNLNAEQQNQMRQDINKQIQNILDHNKDLILKKALDRIKKQIVEVINLFKSSLEDKYNKKIGALEKKVKDYKLRLVDAEKAQESVAKEDLIPQKYISQPNNSVINHTLIAQGLSPQNEDESQILERLEPQLTNAKGQKVVEIEKVYKDLQVIYQSMKASKFFHLCIQNDNNIPETIFDVTEEYGDEIVKSYRDLLNYFSKLFVKLNNGAEQLQKQNELFKLKLLNQDLRETNYKLKLEIDCHFEQEKVNQMLDYITNDQMLINMLSEDAVNVLTKIQDLSPNLDKLMDHQKSMVDLFTLNQTFQVNKNCAEINQKCQHYLEQFNLEEFQQEGEGDNQEIHLEEQQQQPQQYTDFHNSFDNTTNQYDETQTNFGMMSCNNEPVNNNNNISSDQAVDIIAQVLQKFIPQQQQQQLQPINNLNNTQEHSNFMRTTSPGTMSQYSRSNQPLSQERRQSAQPPTLQNMEEVHGHQNVNEDCIKQAESLLMFIQGHEENKNQSYINLGSTVNSHISSISNADKHRPPMTAKSQTNLPLQKARQKMQEDEMWSRNNPDVNNTILHYSTSIGAKRQSNKTDRKYSNQNRQSFNDSQNFRSLDNISNISKNAFSAQAQNHRQPNVPSMHLRQQKSGNLNTAEDYQRLQKQKSVEQRRTNSTNTHQLLRIESEVSPISKKQQLQSRQDSFHSAQQPGFIGGARQQQYQTVDAHQERQQKRPILPRSKRPPITNQYGQTDQDVHTSAQQSRNQEYQTVTFQSLRIDENKQHLQQQLEKEDLFDGVQQDECSMDQLANEKLTEFQTLHSKQREIMSQLEEDKQTIPIYESKEVNGDQDDVSSTSTNQQLQMIQMKQKAGGCNSQGSMKANNRYS